MAANMTILSLCSGVARMPAYVSWYNKESNKPRWLANSDKNIESINCSNSVRSG